MKDYMIRATAADDSIRAFAATTRQMVEFARQAHDTTPVCTAALGRLLTGGVMIGSMLKEDQALVTLQIHGDGPAGGITVTADSHYHAKGYLHNPHVQLPLKANGKLDVSGAVGKGTLTVIRDIGLKEPYVGTIDMPSGEIAEDLTYYFAESEQIPSSVGLGVLVDRDWSVRQAGGFILQMMPGAPDEVIDALEAKLAGVSSVTSMLEEGKLPEDILEDLIGSFGLQVMEKHEVSFACNCSMERIEKALISIGPADVQEMIEDGKPIEVGCQFCGKKYRFDVDALRRILAIQKQKR
ncbi:MAG TPA: Hsp33 family molecular chaperone HslO [Lachnospiraceae bacterium]|nr:Hsp33 family molecular chaperone HslO [Lachnospiraceae bacterium]